jgi:transcriptional regulator with XRE-family HTH domain
VASNFRNIDPFEPEIFGKALLLTRKRLGVSAYRIDAQTDIGRPYLSRIESGKKSPSRITVLKIGISLFSHGLSLHQIDGLLVLAGYSPLLTGDAHDPRVKV